MRTIPKDFLRALQQSGLDDFFRDCPYVPRLEYLSWIASARTVSTRRRRIQKSVVRLFVHWTDEMNLVRAEFAAAGRNPVETVRLRHPATEPRRRSA